MTSISRLVSISSFFLFLNKLICSSSKHFTQILFLFKASMPIVWLHEEEVPEDLEVELQEDLQDEVQVVKLQDEH